MGTWSQAGLVEEDIARNMGVSRSTLSTWKARFPDLDRTIRTNKEIADARVESALYHRAIGYDYTEETRELRLNRKTGEMEMTVTRIVTKHVPGDVLAQIYWTKNREPSRWKDRPEAGTGTDGEEEVVIIDDIREYDADADTGGPEAGQERRQE